MQPFRGSLYCRKAGAGDTHLGRKGLENLLVLTLGGGQLDFLFHSSGLLRFLCETRDSHMWYVGGIGRCSFMQGGRRAVLAFSDLFGRTIYHTEERGQENTTTIKVRGCNTRSHLPLLLF